MGLSIFVNLSIVSCLVLTAATISIFYLPPLGFIPSLKHLIFSYFIPIILSIFTSRIFLRLILFFIQLFFNLRECHNFPFPSLVSFILCFFSTYVFRDIFFFCFCAIPLYILNSISVKLSMSSMFLQVPYQSGDNLCMY